MPVELTDAILFMLFLGMFVLFGTTPVLPRLFALPGKLLRKLQGLTGDTFQQDSQLSNKPHRWRENELNDYEIIIIRKLAMSGDRGLSRKELIRSLYFKPASLDRALRSLHSRGLIRLRKGTFLGLRFRLTVAGTEYARQQDMVPRYQLSGTRKSARSLLR